MSAFEIAIPAAKGIQARRAHFVAEVPLRYVVRLFRPSGNDAPSKSRGVPPVDMKRARELARYIRENPSQYVIPPIIACIDGSVEFKTDSAVAGGNVGFLRIPMDARISVNVAQLWIAAIEMALEAKPGLGDETVSAVFIPEMGLKRSRQIFADLTRYSIRTPASRALLFDQRDEATQLAKAVMLTVPFFAELTETEKSSISNRSTKLFTLSAIYGALQSLFTRMEFDSAEEKTRLAAEFWTEVGQNIPAWQLAKEHKVATADLRRDFIHAHALALAAIARAGNQLLTSFPRNWKAKVKKLLTLDWSRKNAAQWDGRAMNAGRLSKRSVNVTLTANLVKKHLGLPLSSDEEQLESEFQKTHRSSRAKAL